MTETERHDHVNDQRWLAHRFETHRDRLRGLAYRMLGSTTEAEDAVQESWLRLTRTGAGDIEDLAGWLRTVVSRVCLDMLRARRARAERSVPRVPDPVVSRGPGGDPEHQALLADSVGLALLVVLEELDPPERLAFVLHDMFGVPFKEIAEIVGRSPAAARKLASRARRRVQGSPTVPDTDLSRQREIVDAFLAASRRGDFDALLDVLDPDCVLRADVGKAAASRLVRGARSVAEQAVLFSARAPHSEPAVVNGAAGLVVERNGRLLSVMGFTVVNGRIVAIDILADRERLEGLRESR